MTPLSGSQAGSPSSHPIDRLRQPEIEEFGSGLYEHDVCGLQVAMYHAVTMCLVERIGDLNGVVCQNSAAAKRNGVRVLRDGAPLPWNGAPAP